jgi:hypothetical protein
MDQVDKGDQRFYLIGLQMPDKMPPDIGRQLPLLFDQFLDIIFPKIPLAHRIQLQDIGRRLGFGNRNELNTRS